MRNSFLLALATLVGCSGSAQPPSSRAADIVNKRGANVPVSGRTAMNGSSIPRDTLPLAPRSDVIDVYHGVKVVDPYRWMETPSAQFSKWLKSQDGHTRRLLAAIPGRNALRDQLRAANRGSERMELLKLIGEQPRIFAMRGEPDDESMKLVVRDGWDGTDRVLIDPNQRSQNGSHVTIGDAFPSPNGAYVAYTFSAAGSEDETIEIIDVETGRLLADRIDRTQQADISWRPDGRSFFYWRRAKPRPGHTPADWYRNSATHLHVLGEDPEAALPVITPTIRELGLGEYDGSLVKVTPRSSWALAAATPGPADAAYFVAQLKRVRPGATRWRKVATATDKVAGMLVHGDRLFALTYSDAPNYRIVSFDARAETISNAKDFVAESELVLVNFAGASDALYVVVLDRSFHRLLRVPWNGVGRQEIKLPLKGSVGRIVSDADRPGVVFSMEGWARPPGWYQFDVSAGLRKLPVARDVGSPEGLETEETTVLSKNGIEVPLSIIRRRDLVLNGTAPALLSGYGAYGFPTIPNYNPFTLTWVQRGGVYAICHVRGGGARGKSWHLAGIKQNKEAGVDDYIACARQLISKRYTSASRLTATGTSAGGVVVGGAITKRPELFTAAVLRVPLVNLLRDEVSEGGPGNAIEFGNVRVEAEFRSLLASDPYHRLQEGVTYPAVLLTGGLHDPRVPVWQPAKLAARLQATSRSRQTLLRVEFDAGHGIGSTRTQREEEFADLYAFALWQAGVRIR